MTPFDIISDYFPLAYDIHDTQTGGYDDLKIKPFDADVLLTFADQNKLNEIQTLMLLTKNAFEGHCLLNGLPPGKLVESGTLQINFEASENYFMEWTSAFVGNINQYKNGIKEVWKNYGKLNSTSDEVLFLSLFHLILCYQLFRFPVAFLSTFDTQKLSARSLNPDFIKMNFRVFSKILNSMARKSFIELVNEQYNQQFETVQLQLQSKENVLNQMLAKLDMANQPSVKTNDDLEKAYFDFMVATQVTKFEKKKYEMPAPDFTDDHEKEGVNRQLVAGIRKLYKIISKNCREVHTSLDGQERYPQLGRCFIAANAVYNFISDDDNNRLIVQYLQMILLLCKAVNNRMILGLPIQKTNKIEHVFNTLADMPEEKLIECQKSLGIETQYLWLFYMTEFKLKFIRDNEMAEIHRDYLHRKIKFFETRIHQVTEEISSVMLRKHKTSGQQGKSN
jgi:hypothetical protein